MEVIDLAGRRALVVGVANADSLAWSAARHFRSAGAELAVTHHSEKSRPFVAPLAKQVQARLLPCNDRVGAQGRPAGAPHRLLHSFHGPARVAAARSHASIGRWT